MTIDSFDAVFYTCIFLLPGFIIKSVLDMLVPPIKSNDVKYFFSCLLYSIINCAVWSWAYILLNRISKIHPVIYWISLVATTVIGATLIAIIIGFVKQKGFVEWIFSKSNIKKIHPVPTAWDYYFSKQQESWVIVTLKNGKTVYGRFSDQSFASSDNEERDIYIEKIYDIDKDMIWVEDERSNGILITKDEIETIEFLI